MSTDFNLIAKDIQRKYRRRVEKNWWERYAKPENGVNPYTGLPEQDSVLLLKEEELNHILKLNRRCLKLTKQLIKDVEHITNDMCKKIKSGDKAYKDFNVLGYIYVEVPYEENEIFRHMDGIDVRCQLCITSEDHPEVIDRPHYSDDFFFFGNWQSNLRDLYDEKTGKGIKLCTAFCELFDWSELFTIEELMQVRPSDIYSQIKIHI